MTRINLQIDDKFASVLKTLSLSFPLLTEPDLIKVAVGDFYNRIQLEKQIKWIESLPVLQITKEQAAQLDDNLTSSIASGFVGPMNKEDFFASLAA